MSKKGKTKMSKKTKGIIAGATALVVVLIGGNFMETAAGCRVY